MIKGLSAVSIWSADLNNLLPFYRDRLGLPVAIESPRFVVLGAPGGPSVGLGTHRDVRGPQRGPGPPHDRARDRRPGGRPEAARGGGVEFVEDPTDYDTVSIATCRDPEGNLVRLIQRRP